MKFSTKKHRLRELGYNVEEMSDDSVFRMWDEEKKTYYDEKEVKSI